MPDIERQIRAIVRRPGMVLAIAFSIVALCVVLALRLRLVTDLAALLPSDDPAVLATQRVQDRLGGVTPLQIAIESPRRDANLRFAKTLAASLAREPKSLVEHVAIGIQDERAFVERNRWLYVELADLEHARDRLRHELALRKNPLLVDLDDDGESLDAIEARIRARAKQVDRYPDGYFMTADGGLAVILVWPPEAQFREHAGEALVERVEAVIAEARAREPDPAMRVRLAGSIYDSILERHALESDLAWSSGLCVLLVSLVVALFYGRLRAVPLMAAPALCGVAVALGAGSLAFGQLNASTAFLGSIILGNGINAAIIQLARYEEERRAGASLEDAVARSVTGTMRATATASLAAAIAYGSLMLTTFRGFSQFGAIGAIGMAAAWVATIVVLPALIAVVDRRRDVARVRRGIAFGVPFAMLAGRWPRAVLGAALVISLGAIAVVVPYLRDPFEYDLRELRSVQSADRRELRARIESIFGTLTPTILLAERQDQTAELAQALRERGTGVLGEVLSLDRVMPGSPELQQRKLAVLAEIRALFADARRLDPERVARYERWEPPAALVPVTPAQLPLGIVRPFRDVRGELAPVVIAYRSPAISYWNGRDLLRLAAVVRTVRLADGSEVHAGGNAVVFAGMIEAIVRDGPVATFASLIGVALLVIVLARGLRGAAIVLAALVIGVLWMVGGAALAGERVNFLNFIALPLTFGIGVDYAINIYLRHREHGPAKIVETLRATGGAVALCSLTTTIGYASLLVADSQGLRSFGALAILGELTCLSVALLLLPAWLGQRRGSR